jgi:hypothetical protein
VNQFAKLYQKHSAHHQLEILVEQQSYKYLAELVGIMHHHVKETISQQKILILE